MPKEPVAQQGISDDRAAARATVDALRECLGYAPLYRAQRHNTSSWLDDVTDRYRANKSGRTATRGSAT